MINAMFRFLRYIIPLILLAGDLHGQGPAETEDIRGPKAQVEIPVQAKPRLVLWSSVAGGGLLLVLAVALWQKRIRKASPKSPPEVALAALAELEFHRESLTAEAFASRATQAVRLYIEARFSIAAPRRTTEEFLDDVARDTKSGLLGESEHLQTFLKSCDLAKFADSGLDTSQRNELVTAARNFVHSTSKAIPA